MQKLAAAVVVVAMLGGCSYRGSKAAAIVGGLMVIGGVASIAVAANEPSGCGGQEEGCIGLLATGVALSLPGALLTIVGLVGMASGPDDEAEERPSRDRRAKRRRRRARALLDEAIDSAREGDCATVVDRDGEVRELAPEFHATEFVHDADIKKCLDESSDVIEQPADTR